MRFSRPVAAVVVIAGVIGALLAPPVAAQGGKANADDVGITDKEIRLAVIADVENAVVPGLFQPSVDVVRAWAKLVNKKGGKITTTQKNVVAADGKTRTVTTTGTDAAGQKVSSVALYEKQ